MTPVRRVLACALAALLAGAGEAAAQADGVDPTLLALAYHRLSGDPLDLRGAAEASDAARNASSFDRPDIVKAEMARLRTLLASAAAPREFVLRIPDAISEYDRDRGEFSIQLFRSGFYVPVEAFGQVYRIVFTNAGAVRAIRLSGAPARELDAELSRTGRNVTNEIRFRVVGKGDPAGGVTGPRVVRAEILATRLLDATGHVVFTPTVMPGRAAGGVAAFDPARADVAGFRVGVRVDALVATLSRLFGHVTRAHRGDGEFAGFAGSLTVNPMGCVNIPGRRRNPEPGAVCVTAFFDRDDVVRSIRVERVFPWFDAEVFRRTLVQRYGAAATELDGGGVSLGWGPEVNPTLLYDRSGPRNALTARYAPNDDLASAGLAGPEDIRVVLQLVDASWASARAP